MQKGDGSHCIKHFLYLATSYSRTTAEQIDDKSSIINSTDALTSKFMKGIARTQENEQLKIGIVCQNRIQFELKVGLSRK